MKVAGIILIIIGVLALAYQGFSYTQNTQVAKIGSLEINAPETHTVWVPPVIGAVCVAVGVGALVMGARGK